MAGKRLTMLLQVGRDKAMPLSEPRARRVRRKPGQFVEISLGDGSKAFGRVLEEPLIAFYDYKVRSDETPPLEEVAARPVAFRIWVMKYAVTQGHWEVIGSAPLTSDLQGSPSFFKQDAIDGSLAIYNNDWAPDYERPATEAECAGLECAAVWDPEHVEDRLRDHFARRPNIWVESMRIKART